MYEWLLVLTVFIDEMVFGQLKAMKTKRMKFVLFVAARLGIREETENLVNPQKKSGEVYARRILEFLKTVREEKLRKKEEEDNRTKRNGSAGIQQEEGKQTKLDPRMK